MFADILKTPAVQALARRMEPGGALTFSGVAAPAQPFFAALLQKLFPQRPIVVVTENLKTQESFQQDLETWLQVGGASCKPTPRDQLQLHLQPQLLFYPAWEILPHEGKLPHADVISDRLQTLVALSQPSQISNLKSQIIVTSVTALLQKTFPPGEIQSRTRALARGDKIAPLDLIEFLEDTRLRAGGAGFAERRNRLARRHRGHFSADESVAGAAGVFRRRTGIAP